MTVEELGKLVRTKEAEHRAKLTPEQRAEEDRRREENRRAEEEEYLAKKDKTVPLLEHEQVMEAQEQYYEIELGELQDQLAELIDAAQTFLSQTNAVVEERDNQIKTLLVKMTKIQGEVIALAKRRAGMTAKINDLTRKLKLAEAENARLRGNDTK